MSLKGVVTNVSVPVKDELRECCLYQVRPEAGVGDELCTYPAHQGKKHAHEEQTTKL